MTAELTFKVIIEIPDEFRDNALKETPRMFLFGDAYSYDGVILDTLNHDKPAYILTEITEL